MRLNYTTPIAGPIGILEHWIHYSTSTLLSSFSTIVKIENHYSELQPHCKTSYTKCQEMVTIFDKRAPTRRLKPALNT